MSPILHHQPATDHGTHHRFDFLRGIDLDRVHVRGPDSRRPWVAVGIILLLLVVTGALLLRAPVTDVTSWSLHDSGIARAVQEHDAELGAMHDSGITRAVEERGSELEAMHDSGIALRERNP